MFDPNEMNEAEYQSSQTEEFDSPRIHVKSRARHNTRKNVKFVDNTNRYCCLTAGCNPVMYGEEQANEHKESTGHRTAKWPVRSAAGRAKERRRQTSGYYDKYNVGAKSYGAREHLI